MTILAYNKMWTFQFFSLSTFMKLQVLSGGSKIDFYLFEPNEHHPNMERYGVKEFEQYKLKVNVTGDHKFCFSNIYQSHAINVAFEYELFEESEEAETSLQKDVRAFYDNVQDQLHEMFKEEGFKEKHEVVQNFLMTNLLKKNKEEIYAHKSTDEKLKVYLLSYSVYTCVVIFLGCRLMVTYVRISMVSRLI